MSFRQPLAPVEVNHTAQGGATCSDGQGLKPTPARALVSDTPAKTEKEQDKDKEIQVEKMHSLAQSTVRGHTPTSARTPLPYHAPELKWKQVNGNEDGRHGFKVVDDSRFSQDSRIKRSIHHDDENQNESERRVRRHGHAHSSSTSFSESTNPHSVPYHPRSYPHGYSHTPYPLVHPRSHVNPHTHTPYSYSPTPTLSYSPYDNSPTRPHPHPHHPVHMRQHSHPHPPHPEMGQAYTSANTTTPTPASRARRPSYIATTPSRMSSAVPTPASNYSRSSQQPGIPRTPTSWNSNSSSECHVLELPKPLVSKAQLELFGLDAPAQWQGPPPPRWLDGEHDASPVAEPANMVEGSKAKKAWEKLCSNTRHFKSHNPWDYIASDSRQHFALGQKKFLECLWKLDASPCVSARERLGSWLGCSSRRVTIFFQNRRQTFTKVLSRTPGDREGSRTESSFDDVFSSGRSKTSSIYGQAGRGCFAPVKLNIDPGSLDENWKWTGTLGIGERPEGEMIEHMALVYAIITGHLEDQCYFAQYMAGRSPVSGASDKLVTPAMPVESQARRPQSSSGVKEQPRTAFWTPAPTIKGRPVLEDFMHARDQGLPDGRRSTVQPRRNEYGDIINLASFLPTDPPSEGPEPGSSSAIKPKAKRGDRVPDLAIRAEKAIRHGRASAQDIYCSSARAKAQSQSQSQQSIRGPMPSLNRTMSMPTIATPQLPPKAGMGRKSYPAPVVRVPLNTKPRDSFSRSRSEVDIRRRPSESDPLDSVFEHEHEQEHEEVEGGGKVVPAGMSEDVELLMGLSQCTSTDSA